MPTAARYLLLLFCRPGHTFTDMPCVAGICTLGFQMQTRVRNYRATWTYNDTEPIAGNYVPINAATYIQDADNGNRLTIMTGACFACCLSLFLS